MAQYTFCFRLKYTCLSWVELYTFACPSWSAYIISKQHQNWDRRRCHLILPCLALSSLSYHSQYLSIELPSSRWNESCLLKLYAKCLLVTFLMRKSRQSSKKSTSKSWYGITWFYSHYIPAFHRIMDIRTSTTHHRNAWWWQKAACLWRTYLTTWWTVVSTYNSWTQATCQPSTEWTGWKS